MCEFNEEMKVNETDLLFYRKSKQLFLYASKNLLKKTKQRLRKAVKGLDNNPVYGDKYRKYVHVG
jgi:hypothetical protein